ncbi:exodeoxyribonuclease III [Methylobacillus caricis]|uniref:exodeoxyribonuclease III n=1 Tax=Methylobacillus caricis TaxID=1971611 RepID=UPI001CFF9556|nr:exodeoxyribonuclease III [Methylobacillus caricis]MCB5188301.1 exodeoxyribonuclease III [Methylobacillus caricis]
MKLATWNVNSLNVRLPHVLDWIALEKPDVLCLQETKQEDSKFPYDALKEAGYNAIHSGQKTYNGVAILSPHLMEDVSTGIPGLNDEQKRLIAATIGDVRIVCAYIPNGQSVDSDKYQYKLGWLEALSAYLKDELARYPKLALLGDYNIAPEDRDVHDPAAWAGQVLVSEPEREAFRILSALGLHDSFRLFEQEDSSFSWWDYRMAAFRRNLGLRIDHILVSDALKNDCLRCWIDKSPRKLERPSDHTPVVLELTCA